MVVEPLVEEVKREVTSLKAIDCDLKKIHEKKSVVIKAKKDV